MNIVVISSSHRKNSNSKKVSHYILDVLKKQNNVLQVSIIDLADAKIPFWDDRMWQEGANELKEIWAPYSKLLSEADGFIFVIPEWNGMAPAALHNLFLYCGNGELRHKPALLVTVSTGIGGSYPLSEMRISGYKNTKICYLPEHLIFRFVTNFFDQSNAKDEKIANMKRRTEETLILFQRYCKAFVEIRKEDTFDHQAFKNGM